MLSEGWKKVKAPSNPNIAFLLSIPFVILNGLIFISIAYYLYPQTRELLSALNTNDNFILTFTIDFTTLLELFALMLLMLIHEFLHFCSIPNFIKSDKVYWGMNLLYAFVYTTEEIKKERFIFISVLPLIILSIIFPIILGILVCLNEFILFLGFANAIGSGLDCLNICILLAQVPKGAYIVNFNR